MGRILDPLYRDGQRIHNQGNHELDEVITQSLADAGLPAGLTKAATSDAYDNACAKATTRDGRGGRVYRYADVMSMVWRSSGGALEDSARRRKPASSCLGYRFPTRTFGPHRAASVR